MKSAALIVALAACSASNAVILTQWNFNGDSTTTVPGGATSPTPSVGAGSAMLLGGVTASFASGTANGGSSDPVTTTPANYGWNTTTYAAQGTENGQRGIGFSVSTGGMQDIVVKFDTRHSNTSSKWVRFDYSADGGLNWVLGDAATGTLYSATAGDTWHNMRTANLSGVSAVDNNASFMFRMVTVFGPAGGYEASTSTSSYAATGTLRYDMVSVEGSPVPEPATLVALGLGTLLIRRRRSA